VSESRPRVIAFRRGVTLIEILIALVVAALVAGSVGSLLSVLGGALREQDTLASQLVRTAGGHARLSDHVLRARAILGLSATQAVFWVPSEDFVLSNQYREAFDQINARELRWYTWIPTQKRLVMSRTIDQNDVTVYEHTTNWSSLYNSLTTSNKLETVTVFDGLTSASFFSGGFDPCTTRRVNLDLVFDAEHGGQTIRVSEAIPFLQEHKDCP